MGLKSVRGKVVLKLFINDKTKSGYYWGSAIVPNIKDQFQEAKRRARIVAYHNFFKDGGNIRTQILDEQKNFSEFKDFFYADIKKIEKNALTEISEEEINVYYVGTKRYFKSISRSPKEAKSEATIRVKRENWKGLGYVSVVRKINSGKKSGEIKSWEKWTPKNKRRPEDRKSKKKTKKKSTKKEKSTKKKTKKNLNNS